MHPPELNSDILLSAESDLGPSPVRFRLGRLPVVDRKDPRRMVGYINRASVMGSWRGHLHEESVREHGWFRNISAGGGHRGKGGAVTGRVSDINAGEIRIALDLQTDVGAEEFELTAPARGVFVGDEVRVDYQTDDRGRKIALRIVELSSRQ